MSEQCVVCLQGKAFFFQQVSDIDYFQCEDCKSIFANEEFLYSIDTREIANYSDKYWDEEMPAAKDRAFGSSLQRVAETILYCRIPVKKFIDIGSGPGYLLDALTHMLPTQSHIFYGVEKFPPNQEFRSKHINYKTISLNKMNEKFSAGVCIEVIEHMTPNTLKGMLVELASVSEDKDLYLFNSGQPEFVITEDPNYLDPHCRGHIVSYSTKGLKHIFSDNGFNIIPLPGRTWAFLAEFNSPDVDTDGVDELFNRIWNPIEHNKQILHDPEYGSLMYNIGIDSARCYLEHATVISRTNWALSLQHARSSC